MTKGLLLGKISSYDRALKRDPESDRLHYAKAEAFVDLAKITGEQSYYDEALISYDKAIEFSPQNRMYLIDRSKLYVVLEKFDLAAQGIIEAQKAPSIGDKFLDMHSNHIINNFINLPTIKCELKKIVAVGKISPAELIAYFPNLALETTEIYPGLSDFEAKSNDSKPISITQTHISNPIKTKLETAKTNSLLRDIKSYERSLKKHPSDSKFYHAKAGAFIELAEETEEKSYYDEALLSYAKALELSPQNRVYLVDRSKLYVILEKFDLAAQDIIAAQKAPSSKISSSGEKVLDMYYHNTVRDILKLPKLQLEFKKMVTTDEVLPIQLEILFPNLLKESAGAGSNLSDYDIKSAGSILKSTTNVELDKARSENQEASHIIKLMSSQIRVLQNQLQQQEIILAQQSAPQQKQEQATRATDDDTLVTINVSQYSKDAEANRPNDHNNNKQPSNIVNFQEKDIAHSSEIPHLVSGETFEDPSARPLIEAFDSEVNFTGMLSLD